tara:strand:- start:153 stop:1025 length:873 start_codon:yes stop_codon:yes gene_type:complete
MADVTIFCFLASYLVAFALELVRLRKPGRVGVLVGGLFSLAGFVAHTWFLWNRGKEAELPPLLSSSQDWTLVLAWLAVGLYLFLIACDRKLSIGVFLYPLVLMLVGVSYLLADSPSDLAVAEEAARNGWAMLHVSSLVLGAAGVLIGTVLSLMYLWQHRRLRHKSMAAGGLSLPSLERLARMNWWSVMVSVPLLTIGMGTGLVLLLSGTAKTPELSLSDPVVVANGLSWLGLVGLFGWLLLRPTATGKQVAWRTLLACGFLLVTVVGLSVLTSSGGVSSGHASVRVEGVR